MPNVNVKICIAFIIILSISSLFNIFATDADQLAEDLDLNDVVKQLNEYVGNLNLENIANSFLKGETPEYSEFKSGVVSTLKEAISSAISDVIYLLIFITVVAVITSVTLEKNNTFSKSVAVICMFVVLSILLAIFTKVLNIAKDTLMLEMNIVQIVSPFLMSMLLLTGAVSTVSLIQPLLLLVIQIINFSISYIVVPLITLSVVFSVITNMSENINMKKVGTMCSKSALWINGILLALFLAIASIETIVTTSLDSITVKTTQSAVSSVIPVVGRFVSDSVEFIFGATELIGKTGGAIAIIALVIVVISPVIKIMIIILATNFVIVVAEAINVEESIVKLIADFCDIYKDILGILISTSVIFIISISIAINIFGKVVN